MTEKFIGEGLTFDDVLIVPGESSVLPSQVDVSTSLTKNIRINIPLLSAAMDTVTEAPMAIAMSREGGIGIIHKNMTAARQAAEVQKVKRFEAGMVIDPVTLSPDHKVRDAVELMDRAGVSGIPIVKDGILNGIITNRDMRFQTDPERLISDFMIKGASLITAPLDISMEEAQDILHKNRIEKLPVVNSSGKLMGLITLQDINKRKSKPNACLDKDGRLLAGAAVGVTADTPDRVAMLKDAGVDVVVLDTAHGHQKLVVEMLRKLKKRFSGLDVIAGNIATGEAAEVLIGEGADALKVGIGPGSICTTRVIAGVGVPQITAVYNVAAVASKKGIPVIADGGIHYAGDTAKAVAAGADLVMVGSMLAGTDESPGELILYKGRRFKTYRGMGSVEAMKEGSKDRYFQSENEDEKKFVPEGIEGRVPYKGAVMDSIYQLVGSFKSAMGYSGAANIKEMKEKARFVKVTPAGQRESHPHDVVITKEAPNYKLGFD